MNFPLSNSRQHFLNHSILVLDNNAATNPVTIRLNKVLEARFTLVLREVVIKGVPLGADTQAADRFWKLRLEGHDRTSIFCNDTLGNDDWVPLPLEVIEGSQTMSRDFSGQEIHLTNVESYKAATNLTISLLRPDNTLATFTSFTFIFHVLDKY